jgi:hypothetical protein
MSNLMKYCKNTESCNDISLLTQHEETLHDYLQVCNMSSFSYLAGAPTIGYLFPYLLQHVLIPHVYNLHDAVPLADSTAAGSQG